LPGRFSAIRAAPCRREAAASGCLSQPFFLRFQPPPIFSSFFATPMLSAMPLIRRCQRHAPAQPAMPMPWRLPPGDMPLLPPSAARHAFAGRAAMPDARKASAVVCAVAAL
jgi:hypothetical protein